MAPIIFITGATGYIGGDVLHELYTEHPQYNYVALVRTQEKGKQVQHAFPRVRVVYGELDDANVMEKESAEADIVIHTADASDNEPAARAIAKGLAIGHSVKRPGYWIHTGGTGILTYTDADAERYGEESQKIYNDVDGVGELTTLPDHAFHRNIDKIVLEAGTRQPDVVRTALLCPPTIYGAGRGPCNTRSRQAYELGRATLENKKAPVLGKGLTWWNNVHVADLARCFRLVVEAAVRHDDDPELWGERGYYFVENGEHQWGKLAHVYGRAAAAKGYIPTSDTEAMDPAKAKKLAGFEALSWGLNSRGKAVRARKHLGWSPHERSIEDEVPTIVESEYERLHR